MHHHSFGMQLMVKHLFYKPNKNFINPCEGKTFIFLKKQSDFFSSLLGYLTPAALP
jgi:hypothetical protein